MIAARRKPSCLATDPDGFQPKWQIVRVIKLISPSKPEKGTVEAAITAKIQDAIKGAKSTEAEFAARKSAIAS